MSNEEKIRQFILKNLAIFDDDVSFSNSDNIFELGFVNSLFAMHLLRFIEQEYNFQISPDDMNIQNFSSVDNICCLIDRHTALA